MRMMPSVERVPRVGLLAAATLLLTLGLGACDSGGGSDKGGGQKVSALASHAPADVQFAAMTPSVEKFQKAYSGQWGEVQTTFEAASADDVSLVDPDSMSDVVATLNKMDVAKSGLDLEGPVMATVYDDTGILAARVNEKNTFNTFVSDLFEGESTEKDVDGRTVRMIEAKGKRDVPVGWVYSGSMVALGSPSAGGPKDLQEGLTNFLQERKSDNSLNDQKEFNAFRQSLVDSKSLSTYVSTSQNKELQKGLEQNMCGKYSAYKQSLCDAITGQTQGAGFAMKMPSDDHVQLRGWMGWKSKGIDWFKNNLKATRALDWKRFATEDTTVAMRMAVNPSSFWEDFKGSLKDRNQQSLEQSIRQMESASGGDFKFERDIVETLSGQAGMFLYEIGKMRGGPSAAAMTSKYLFVFQTKEGNKPKTIIEQLKSMMGPRMPGDLKIQPLETSSGEVEGIQVAEIANTPLAGGQIPKLYLTDQLMVLASGALSGDDMRDIFKGERDVGSISKADDVKVGTPFAEEDHLTGLYVNTNRLVSQLKKRAKGIPDSFWSYLEPMSEVAMTTRAQDDGVFATLESRGNLKKVLEKLRSLGEPRQGGGQGSADSSGKMQLEEVGKDLDLNLDSLQQQQDVQEKNLDNLDKETLDNLNKLGN